jgi:hypothetical protein
MANQSCSQINEATRLARESFETEVWVPGSNREFSFTLGVGQVIPCWDEGIKQVCASAVPAVHVLRM